jgi:uncharacterized protein (DUF736 family)
MANIGTFTKNEAGAFIGEIVTLSFQAKNVRLIPETNRANENARATRLCRPRRDRRLAQALRRTARLPLGQARRSELQRLIYANLFNDEEGDSYTLIWSRRRRPGTSSAD